MTGERAGRFLSWTPDPEQRVTLRTGGSEDERAQIPLDELTLRFTDDAMAPVELELRFSLDYETFTAMAAKRWFQIPLGFLDTVAFDPARAVAMVVASAPMTRGGFPIQFLFTRGEETDEAKLATVLEPFLDPELERPVNNPLTMEVVRVSQAGDDAAGRGFDRAMIAAWESGR